jgi:hypothetical protein
MKRYFLDAKQTIWERVEIPEEWLEEAGVKDALIKAIEEGEITCLNDLWHFADQYGLAEPEIVTLYNTMESMTPEQNGGCSTLEFSETKTGSWGELCTWKNGRDYKYEPLILGLEEYHECFSPHGILLEDKLEKFLLES